MTTPFSLALTAAGLSLGFLAIFTAVLAMAWWLLVGRGEVHPRNKASNAVQSPAAGIVISCPVHAGDRVAFGQTLCLLESAGQKLVVRASRPGEIGTVAVAVGDVLTRGQEIMAYRLSGELKTDEPGASLD